ncbi:MAG: hypothetical protein SVY53_12840 [Chloroflexota bacterium]|nr:hypothetical protein [Chloroflexota bacterium]
MIDTAKLVEMLCNPEIYPDNPVKTDFVQTQMSLIFLTGSYVYKVKKPVDLGFLDYSTLEKRREFCFQELRLNQRLCPGAYLDVVPIVMNGEHIAIGGQGEIVEYAVKMCQLPRDRTMDVLIRAGQVTESMVEHAAQKVAEFHRNAETNEEISSYGGLDTINTNTGENFSQTEKYIGLSITAEQHKRIKAYTESFIARNTELFDKRRSEGRIRDCHGDLHAAHVCFADEICIFDCIEFNDRFRYGDVASEVAFLSMDLDRYQRPDLSQVFYSAYVEASGDKELLQLLSFYKCYRACVRGKVESFKLDDPLIAQEEKDNIVFVARRYFELAESYIVA